MQHMYIVTHAQSLHHLEGKVGGWYDTGLSDLGRLQAQAIAARLEAMDLGEKPFLVSSDLRRASETAMIIGDKLDIDVKLDAGFREISYGEAEGQPQSWLDERISIPPETNRLDHAIISGAETKRAFVQRIYDSMSRLPTASNGIIVTHGYALTFAIANWIGMPLENATHVNFAASPGGLTHLLEDDFFRNRAVKTLNDVAHLQGVSLE